jgi:hypothetical protein
MVGNLTDACEAHKIKGVMEYFTPRLLFTPRGFSPRGRIIF